MDKGPVWTATGRFEQVLDWISYRAALPAAQRLGIELRDLDEAADGGLMFLNAWTGAASDGWFEVNQARPQVVRTTLQIDEADTLQLTFSGPAGHEYALRIWPLPADDHGDSPDSATPQTLGDDVAGFIDADGDRDVLAFALEAGQDARFHLESGGAPLQLRDPLGHWQTGYSGDLICVASVPGRYILVLGSVPGHEGPYLLHTEPFVDDHGNTPATATLLEVGKSIGGQMDGHGDIDVFAVELQPGQRYEVHGSGLGAPGLSLAAYDALTSEWLAMAMPTPQGDAVAWIDRPNGGRVDLLVRNDGDLARVGYALSLSAIPRDDHGDTPSTATVLQIGQTVTGCWTNAADADVFTLDVKAGQRLQIALQGEGGELAADTLLWLESAVQPTLIAQWQPWDHPAARHVMTWQAEVDGRLEVHTGAGTKAAYSLRVDLLAADDHGDLASSASPLSLGQPVSGTLQAGADTDCFSFDALAHHLLSYRIEAAAGSSLDSLMVWMEEPSGYRMSNWLQPIGAGARTVVGNCEAAADGRVALHLDARTEQDRGYTLIVWQDEAVSGQDAPDAAWLTPEDTTPMGMVSFEPAPASGIDWP